jgi:hypothetical protein
MAMTDTATSSASCIIARFAAMEEIVLNNPDKYILGMFPHFRSGRQPATSDAACADNRSDHAALLHLILRWGNAEYSE